MEKRKLAEKIAKFYLRYNRGSGLISFFPSMLKDVAFYGILLDLAHRYLGITIPYVGWIIGFLVFFAIVVYYVMGLLDEKVGFWKIQNDYANRELTPFFKNLEEKIEKIHQKLAEKI